MYSEIWRDKTIIRISVMTILKSKGWNSLNSFYETVEEAVTLSDSRSKYTSYIMTFMWHLHVKILVASFYLGVIFDGWVDGRIECCYNFLWKALNEWAFELLCRLFCSWSVVMSQILRMFTRFLFVPSSSSRSRILTRLLSLILKIL